MLTTYFSHDGHLSPQPGGNLQDALWIDLFEPTTAEEQRVEADLHMELPTRDEMREVESSSGCIPTAAQPLSRCGWCIARKTSKPGSQASPWRW